LPAARKEGEGANRKVVAPGAMLIFVAGAYPIYGTQMLYFVDAELNRRASFVPPTKFYIIEHNGDLASPGTLHPSRRLPSTTVPLPPMIVKATAQEDETEDVDYALQPIEAADDEH